MSQAAIESHTSASGRGARIEVSGLWKEYPHGDHTVPVLRDVDLLLQAGDMVAIVGASGVGKSTLLHVLGTLDLPTRGSIRFNGEEITAMGPARLADFRNREIGFVFQFHHLLPEFTALENVMMPALIQRIPRNRASRDARDILGRVGLAQRLTHKPSELSGGEQQRVALARAMVLAPSLLLADEPTGNLDRRTGEEIHELFVELNRERGSTLLVVTHNRELAEMMPRCLRMLDGGGLEEVRERASGFEIGGQPAAKETDKEAEAQVPTPTTAAKEPQAVESEALPPSAPPVPSTGAKPARSAPPASPKPARPAPPASAKPARPAPPASPKPARPAPPAAKSARPAPPASPKRPPPRPKPAARPPAPPSSAARTKPANPSDELPKTMVGADIVTSAGKQKASAPKRDAAPSPDSKPETS